MYRKNEAWEPEEDLVGDLASKVETAVTSDPPKICDCQHGLCELDDCLDEQPTTPSKSSDPNISNTSSGNVPAHDKHDREAGVGDSEANQVDNQPQPEIEPSDTPTKEELEIHEDLSESCNSMNNSHSRRQIKANNMRSNRQAYKEARKSRRCLKQERMNMKLVSSKSVNNNLIQDYSSEMVVVGTDVVSLYPNLTWASAGEEVFRAIMESNIEWQQVNWKEGCRYLALCRGYTWCRTSTLRRVLPWRRFAKGSWPGITGAGPMGPSVNGEEQWIFPDVVLTELEKKTVMGEVMRLAVEVLFRTHVYSFKGNYYRQADGGPIGLRATCAIARVCMAQHSVKWQTRMEDCNINIAGSGFYVDDGRVFMHPLRPGWR